MVSQGMEKKEIIKLLDNLDKVIVKPVKVDNRQMTAFNLGGTVKTVVVDRQDF